MHPKGIVQGISFALYLVIHLLPLEAVAVVRGVRMPPGQQHSEGIVIHSSLNSLFKRTFDFIKTNKKNLFALINRFSGLKIELKNS
jgi:hypothetical protein